MTWVSFLIDHYTERLKEETRPEGRSFIRQTLKQLQHVSTDSTDNNFLQPLACLPSYRTHVETKELSNL
jgi:hypothetical protein